MAWAVQETEFISREQTERSDMFRFERAGHEYPFVDVSFALRALHGRAKIVTDGPYKNVTTSENSKITYRQRSEFSPGLTLEAAVKEEQKWDVASKLADLIFELNEIKEIAEQE